MDEVTCPYCEKECEINHDDGAFYREDEQEEMECPHCEKVFMVIASILYSFTGEKCPCKNGEEHDWQQIHGQPSELLEGKQRCNYCGEERDIYTPEQRKRANQDYADKLKR